jgi:predicted MPP superfamily phosphohydrolase
MIKNQPEIPPIIKSEGAAIEESNGVPIGENHEGPINDDGVSKTLFHRLLVYLGRWTNRPAWFVISFVLLFVAIGATIWFLITGQATSSLIAAGLLTFFLAADAVLFILLPALSISFGSWKSQLIVMLIPRGVISLFAALVAIFISIQWALGIMVAMEFCLSLVLLWGSIVEVQRLGISRVNVKIPLLNKGQRPIRILQISDLHIERLTRRESKLTKLVNEVKPDIIALTGDYLNLSYVSDLQSQNDVKRILSQLKAPGGVYAVLGGPTVDDRDIVPDLFEELPIRLLKNEWEEININGIQSVVLLGLDCSQNIDADGANLKLLVERSPNSSPRVLLYHTPDLMPQASLLGIDLYLSGHTHGGQVRVPFYGALLTSSKFGKKYEMGRYQEGKTVLYVSRGVGLEGLGAPRMRFLSPPEITLFTLKADSSSTLDQS